MATASDDHIHDEDFFEGTEKLLEVWFTGADEDDEKADLRKIHRFVDARKCKQTIKNSCTDSFVALCASRRTHYIVLLFLWSQRTLASILFNKRD